MGFTGSTTDLEAAQRLLDEGKSVREVAVSQGVSTQAIYRLLKRGTLTREFPGPRSPRRTFVVSPGEHRDDLTTGKRARHLAAAEDRFVSSISEPNEDGCILWLGGVDRSGYGRVLIGQGLVPAHRFAWERIHGRLRRNLVIDHLCGVHACVNPEHLEPVAARENFLRGGDPHLHLRGTTA